ncbi:MAG TPA: hypothetical protein PKD24_05360 [Pyrinomonadaceae bacterium]|nr:hypothetical protein [Pyrinomonadaceae bacterium]HMP64979.1 hypothetical protein [Pyrinomonadaceae bacterium]
MFCPKCGNPEQVPETYCRSCGVFLPDLDKLKKREAPLEEHIKINSFFTFSTAVVSLALAAALFVVFISKGAAPLVIYPVFGFLIAITAWQVQTYVRMRLLKGQIERLRPPSSSEFDEIGKSGPDLLPEAALEGKKPASVTERTTRGLSKFSG